jgi:hypothetical protein
MHVINFLLSIKINKYSLKYACKTLIYAHEEQYNSLYVLTLHAEIRVRLLDQLCGANHFMLQEKYS